MSTVADFTIKDLHDDLSRIGVALRSEKEFAPGGSYYEPAVMLLGGFMRWMSPSGIAALTGLPLRRLLVIAVRLRRNGIWMRDGISGPWFDGEEIRTMTFMLDAMVAKGEIHRAGVDEDGEPYYKHGKLPSRIGLP